MAAIRTIVLEYKFSEGHWHEFDRTQVSTWADIQEDRMKREYPTATHRRRFQREDGRTRSRVA
jgi:hypothetical protein